jgi:hypothetical protein
MWWDVTPEYRQEFEHWHSHEHFPERMGIPGFLRGSRWASADEGDAFFVMYELEDFSILTSPGYLERLNQPSPWSTRLMPHHRNMMRSQCHVLHSVGGGIARYALTLRLSAQSAGDSLHDYLKSQAMSIAADAGTTGAHILQTRTPDLPATTEQLIRGGSDRAADLIFVACGYDRGALQSLGEDALSAPVLARNGATPDTLVRLYSLSHTNTAGDIH